MTKVAIDQDGTLSDTIAGYSSVFEDGELSNTEVQTWDEPIERWGADEFLSGVSELWRSHINEIPLVDDTVVDGMYSLMEDDNGITQVDVVTASYEVDDEVVSGKRKWLDTNSILYDDLVVIDRNESKADLDYDYFVDDKPSLPSEVRGDSKVIVRDHPYNRDISSDHLRSAFLIDAVTKIYVDRADSVEEFISGEA